MRRTLHEIGHALRLALWLPLLAVLLFGGTALALHVFALPAFALDVPPHGGQWVVDQARLLPAREKSALAESLRAYAAESGNQIVVLTIPGLQGEDIAAYANRVAREWAVGEKDKNNGVLILVSQAERKVRFEVGRGIEDRLPDLRAKRIQQDITVPHFKAGRYAQGFTETVAAIRLVLTPPGEGAAPETPSQTPARPGPAPSGGAGFPLLTLGLLVLAGLLAVAYFRRNGSRNGASGDSSFWLGMLLGLLSSFFRGRGGGGFGGSGGGGDGGFSGGGGDFGGGGSSSDFGGGDDN
ncbi:MAG: methanol dehydrogenase [Desulfovibrio sp.]|nr:methanol dehydrogenase [Desulfovibrio sp.]